MLVAAHHHFLTIPNTTTQHHPAGLPFSGPLEDPRVASWLLSPDDAAQVTLKSLQGTYAAKFQVLECIAPNTVDGLFLLGIT